MFLASWKLLRCKKNYISSSTQLSKLLPSMTLSVLDDDVSHVKSNSTFDQKSAFLRFKIDSKKPKYLAFHVVFNIVIIIVIIVVVVTVINILTTKPSAIFITTELSSIFGKWLLIIFINHFIFLPRITLLDTLEARKYIYVIKQRQLD